jgi:hypothetical protein
MILLDACVLLNLCATDRLPDIGGCISGGFSVCPAVRQEALFLRDPTDSVHPLKPLILDPLYDAGVIQTLPLGTAEEGLFVNIAVDLDEGEAMSMAIAISRNLDLATDDRKALRLFAQFGGNPDRLWTTPRVIHRWVEAQGIPPEELARVVRAVRDRARYLPPADHPLRAWWLQGLG